jgi:hypothetical protein
VPGARGRFGKSLAASWLDDMAERQIFKWPQCRNTSTEARPNHDYVDIKAAHFFASCGVGASAVMERRAYGDS